MISLKFLGKNLFKNLFGRKFLSTQISLSNVSDNCSKSHENDVNFDDYKSLATNKRIEHKIKIVLNEYMMYRKSDRHRVPSHLSIGQMRQLLECHKVRRNRRIWKDFSADQRKHLLYLMKRSEESGGHNQLIAPFMPLEFEKLYENRLRNASLFGQNVVFDLSFDSYMSSMECKNLAEQINRIYQFNRHEYLKYSSEELPFCLNFCNVDRSGQTFKFMNFLFPNLSSDKSFVNITSESYLDIFAKEQLIYLSPHAEQVMTEYDNNAVFIIGGIVDRSEVITLSQPKAVQQNIRSMRLPIDSLTTKTNIQSLDSVFRVLFDLKAFGIINEKTNFENRIRRHIPNFKLKSVHQTAYERIKSQLLSRYSDDFNNSCEEFEQNSDFKSN